MKHLAALAVLFAGFALAGSYATSVTKFFEMVSQGDAAAVRRAIIEDWPLVEETDEYGQTALIYAIERAPGLVSTLLAHDADPNVRTIAGWTPLAYAIRTGRVDTVRELLEAGARPWVYVDGPSDLIGELLREHEPVELIEAVYLARQNAMNPVPHLGVLSWAYEDVVAKRSCRATRRLAAWLAKERSLSPTQVYSFTSGRFPRSISPSSALRLLNDMHDYSGMHHLGSITEGPALQSAFSDGRTVWVTTVRSSESIFCIEIYPNGF